jgi:enamidase
MVGWARKYGIQSTIHTGGPSIPGSGLIDKDVVLEADTDVVGHINGGHTALPDDQIRCICEGCKRARTGSTAAALGAFTLRTAREMGDLSRIILGTTDHRQAQACSRSASCAWCRFVIARRSCEIAFCLRPNTTGMRAGLRHHRGRALGDLSS